MAVFRLMKPQLSFPSDRGRLPGPFLRSRKTGRQGREMPPNQIPFGDEKHSYSTRAPLPISLSDYCLTVNTLPLPATALRHVPLSPGARQALPPTTAGIPSFGRGLAGASPGPPSNKGEERRRKISGCNFFISSDLRREGARIRAELPGFRLPPREPNLQSAGPGWAVYSYAQFQPITAEWAIGRTAGLRSHGLNDGEDLLLRRLVREARHIASGSPFAGT